MPSPPAFPDSPDAEPGRPRLRSERDGVVSLTGLDTLPPDLDAAAAVVSSLLERAFGEGQHRVEAEIRVDDATTRRALQRAGLRPEGTARGRRLGSGGIPVDVLRLARLATDPAPGDPGAFLGMLNATLPRKRVIAQGIITDGEGRLLLCELTYKDHWDLPGGVVDPEESPAQTLARELREELGVDLEVGDLLAVNWLPVYRQWEDAMLLVFDVGRHPDLADRAQLQPTELRGLHWVAVDDVDAHVAPYVARMIRSLQHREPGGTIVLEDGSPRHDETP